MASWDPQPAPAWADEPHPLEEWHGNAPPYDVEPDDEPAPDVEWADEDEEGQLALGVPGDQRALPGLARPVDRELEPLEPLEHPQNPSPAEVRAMFEGLGWSVTGP